jgi:hypothetical protein
MNVCPVVRDKKNTERNKYRQKDRKTERQKNRKKDKNIERKTKI